MKLATCAALAVLLATGPGRNLDFAGLLPGALGLLDLERS